MTTSDMPTYLRKKSKPLVKSSTTEQFHKNSYTILERLPDERCGERVKA
jgi:hypothetical protein